MKYEGIHTSVVPQYSIVRFGVLVLGACNVKIHHRNRILNSKPLIKIIGIEFQYVNDIHRVGSRLNIHNITTTK